jgi:hypothetical protein
VIAGTLHPLHPAERQTDAERPANNHHDKAEEIAILRKVEIHEAHNSQTKASSYRQSDASSLQIPDGVKRHRPH